MFSIYDGRASFYQWDLDRKLIVNDNSISEVHFCNKTDDCSLVCFTYEENGLTVVNVPNILLQTDWRINVYGVDRNYTKHSACFNVLKRSKPADYIYTDTEVITVEKAVDNAIAEAEQQGKLNNVLYVNITASFDDENEERILTADYTNEEIYKAYQSGKLVYCKYETQLYTPNGILPTQAHFAFENDLQEIYINIVRNKININSKLKKIEQNYTPNSTYAQSGKAVAQAVQEAKTYAEDAVSEKVKVLEFQIHPNLQTENGHSAYYCYSGYGFDEIRTFTENYAFVYGLFYDGNLEHAYPLIMDGNEISFGNTFYPVYIDEAECWTDENSDANLLDSTFNTLWEQTHYVKLAETVLEENAKEIIWTQGANGESLSDYKEFFIYWVGSFNEAATSSEPFVCKGNNGNIYFCYHNTTKGTSKAGFWLHAEEICNGDFSVWKSTYPENWLVNYAQAFSYQTAGLADNNRRVKSNLATTHNSGAITKLHLGSASTGKSMVAGSKAILWGVKR